MRDKKWLEFIRSLPCAMCLAPPPSDAHHSTSHPRGMGLKSGDECTYPLCRGPEGCHMAFHDKKGRFKGWGKEERRSWERVMVDLYAPGGHVHSAQKESSDDVEPF